jgi:hypothetical protein
VQAEQQAAITPQVARAATLFLLQQLHLAAHVVDIKEHMELRVDQAAELDVIKARALVQVQVHQDKAMQVAGLVAHNLLDPVAVVEHHSQDFKVLVMATAAMNAAATVAMDQLQELPVLP